MAAPGQTLSWLGSAVAGYFESAGGALGCPVESELVLPDCSVLPDVGQYEKCTRRPIYT